MNDEEIMSEEIAEDWLRAVGFKWHNLERQPDKHWLLWLGGATRGDQMFAGHEDLGVEVTPSRDGMWFCWLRSDVAHRYSRFLHVRHLRTRVELIKLIEALTGQTWNPANNLYGSMRTPEAAARIREADERLDLRMMRERPAWREIEKDDSRGGALPEHMEIARRDEA